MISYRGRSVTNVLPALLGGLLLLSSGEPADAKDVVLHCTNQFSGATWDTKIDFETRTADSHSASITDKDIKWHDVLHGGHYTFDRVSGDLTVIYASSTGGFSQKHNCRFTQ